MDLGLNGKSVLITAAARESVSVRPGLSRRRDARQESVLGTTMMWHALPKTSARRVRR